MTFYKRAMGKTDLHVQVRTYLVMPSNLIPHSPPRRRIELSRRVRAMSRHARHGTCGVDDQISPTISVFVCGECIKGGRPDTRDLI